MENLETEKTIMKMTKADFKEIPHANWNDISEDIVEWLMQEGE